MRKSGPAHGGESVRSKVVVFRAITDASKFEPCARRFEKVVIIDECSMIGAEMLPSIDSRLKQITENCQVPYGGLEIIFIRDLRQLPPVRATPIYKQKKQSIAGPILWRVLKFYELDQAMRQEDRVFSSILTKIGDELRLSSDEQTLIESRMFLKEEMKVLYPH